MPAKSNSPRPARAGSPLVSSPRAAAASSDTTSDGGTVGKMVARQHETLSQLLEGMAEAVDAIARERAARGSTSNRGSAGDEADQKPLSLSEVSEADLQRLGVEDPHRRSSMTVRPSMGDA